MGLHESKGVLHYSIGKTGHKLVLDIDRGIQVFYRSLIPKSIPTNSVRAAPHITILRKSTPPKLENWGKHEGRKIVFFYDTNIQHDNVYWWLDCYSVDLEQIAQELGLKLWNFPGREPLEGFKKIWHTTIANTKGL